MKYGGCGRVGTTAAWEIADPETWQRAGFAVVPWVPFGLNNMGEASSN